MCLSDNDMVGSCLRLSDGQIENLANRLRSLQPIDGLVISMIICPPRRSVRVAMAPGNISIAGLSS